MDLSLLFISPHKQCRETPPVLSSQQRLHKLRFLQKLGCQKSCWDQARLSSLVNKQVGRAVVCYGMDYRGGSSWYSGGPPHAVEGSPRVVEGPPRAVEGPPCALCSAI